ncbi:hypothetical protein MGN70_007990 [Eutypa lata]|nr:hypothetical protein MGN70_007990 [Eutypa lata]
MPLIDAHLMAAEGMQSLSVRYWWDMRVICTLHHRATALIREARRIQTPDTTAANPARAHITERQNVTITPGFAAFAAAGGA